MRGDRGCGIGGSALAAGSGLRGPAGPALPGGVPALPLAGCPRRSSAPCRRSLISVPSCPRRVFLAVVLITFRAPE